MHILSLLLRILLYRQREWVGGLLCVDIQGWVGLTWILAAAGGDIVRNMAEGAAVGVAFL